MTLLVAFLAAIIPFNAVPIVTNQAMAQARDRWLLCVLALTVLWLVVTGTYWLALMGLWFVLEWPRRGSTLLEHMVPWIAIGASWFMLRAIPDWCWEYIAEAWVVAAIWQSWLCVWNYWRMEWPKDNRPRLGNRTKGSFGSPVLTGIALSAMVPLSPVWLFPLVLPGVYLTFSFTCLLGISIGLAWMYPPTTLPLFLGLLVLTLSMLFAKRQEYDVVGKANWRNQRLMEWSPRGDSVDGWGARLILDRLVWAELWGHRQWRGFGPGTVTDKARQWGSRANRELLSGEVHHDALQHVYEYGVIGALAIVAFVVPIAMHLRVGDPFSAAWLVLLVVSMIHWPARHPALGLMWLAISARLA